MFQMITIQNRTDETIALDESQCCGQSLTVRNVRGCDLVISGHIGAFYLYDSDACDINVRYVKTATNIYNCRDVKLTTVW